MIEREVSKNTANAAADEMLAVEVRATGLSPDAKEVLKRVEQRAYELFESKGRTRGRELENWIEAEAELFQPAAFHVSESKEGVQVDVDVHGFAPRELEVDVEPRRVTVIGKRHTRESRAVAGGQMSTENFGHLVRSLQLPAMVDTRNANAHVSHGILRVQLRKS